MRFSKSQIALFIKSAKRDNRSCALMNTSKWTGTRMRKEGTRETDALRALVKKGLAVYLDIKTSTIPNWNSAPTHVSEYSWRLTPAGLDQMQKLIRKT